MFYSRGCDFDLCSNGWEGEGKSPTTKKAAPKSGLSIFELSERDQLAEMPFLLVAHLDKSLGCIRIQQNALWPSLFVGPGSPEHASRIERSACTGKSSPILDHTIAQSLPSLLIVLAEN